MSTATTNAARSTPITSVIYPERPEMTEVLVDATSDAKLVGSEIVANISNCLPAPGGDPFKHGNHIKSEGNRQCERTQKEYGIKVG